MFSIFDGNQTTVLPDPETTVTTLEITTSTIKQDSTTKKPTTTTTTTTSSTTIKTTKAPTTTIQTTTSKIMLPEEDNVLDSELESVRKVLIQTFLKIYGFCLKFFDVGKLVLVSSW